MSDFVRWVGIAADVVPLLAMLGTVAGGLAFAGALVQRMKTMDATNQQLVRTGEELRSAITDAVFASERAGAQCEALHDSMSHMRAHVDDLSRSFHDVRTVVARLDALVERNGAAE